MFGKFLLFIFSFPFGKLVDMVGSFIHWNRFCNSGFSTVVRLLNVYKFYANGILLLVSRIYFIETNRAFSNYILRRKKQRLDVKSKAQPNILGGMARNVTYLNVGQFSTIK